MRNFGLLERISIYPWRSGVIPALLMLMLCIGLMLWGYIDSFFKFRMLTGFFWDPLMLAATHAGDAAVVICIGLGLTVFLQGRLDIRPVATLALVGLIVSVFKNHVFHAMPRPAGMFWLDEKLLASFAQQPPLQDFTMPSGHSASAVAAALCAGGRYSKPLPQYLAGLLATVIAFSRIQVGAHFPGDVLAGMIIGAMAGSVAVMLPDKLVFSFSRHWMGVIGGMAFAGGLIRFFLLMNWMP